MHLVALVLISTLFPEMTFPEATIKLKKEKVVFSFEMVMKLSKLHHENIQCKLNLKCLNRAKMMLN